MKYLFLSTLLLAISACQPGTPGPPADTIDEYTGHTYVRYGFKSPVNGKEVYYYLSFLKNAGIESYVKYNKTERGPDTQTGTYTQTGTTNTGTVKQLKLTLDGTTYDADIKGNTLIFHNPSGDLLYTKE